MVFDRVLTEKEFIVIGCGCSSQLCLWRGRMAGFVVVLSYWFKIDAQWYWLMFWWDATCAVGDAFHLNEFLFGWQG